jgi:cellulose synthase/poly-beta-1,6-N-acetylglucosamine synthase-like glycosyltransferase
LQPNISIIIAAKNEGSNIPVLINKLRNLNYPSENYEVIIVDDSSTDFTHDITKELIVGYPNFTLVSARDKTLPGKKGALEIGIKNAKYDYIMITDADCLPEKDWLKCFADKFETGYDFVFGIAPYKQEKDLVNKITCFENLRTQILTFATAKIGLPFSCAARSFGYKKTSFEKVGGYSNTTDKLSGDDDLLLREALKNNFKIGTVENKEAFVFTSSKKTFKEYFKQRARHFSTSSSLLFKQKIIPGMWHLLNLFLFLSPVFCFLSPLFVTPFLLKLLFDLIIVQKSQNKFGYKFGMVETIYLQIIYEIFLIVHSVNSIIRKSEWK